MKGAEKSTCLRGKVHTQPLVRYVNVESRRALIHRAAVLAARLSRRTHTKVIFSLARKELFSGHPPSPRQML
jgi:hypothetical protein